MGWGRACRYARHRIVRLADSSRNIALGLAIGAGVSFTPLLGAHFIQAGLLAVLLRANVLAALIGTFVGNPWTFPFMWWAGISFGALIFQLFGLPAPAVPVDEITIPIIWDLIKNDPFRIFVPWFVGGYLLAVFSVPLSYLLFYNLVNGAKLARRKARAQRRRRRMTRGHGAGRGERT